jgi:hypothetical protein
MEGGIYSFVSDAAVRVGSNLVKVRKDQSIYFNKQEATYAQFPLTSGGFPATREVADKCFDIGPIHKCANSMTVEVTLGPQENIIMKVFQDMVRVEVTGGPREIGSPF